MSNAHATAAQAGKAVYNIFLDRVDQRGSVLGMASAERIERGHAVTGKISPAVIKEAAAGYASPGDCYEEASAHLVKDHALVLTGRRGLGKRTGALVMLRDVIGSEGTIVALPPSISLKELAERKYNQGCGYVVFDRVDDGLPRAGSGRSTGSELDHAWLAVLDRLDHFGAFLVVTMIEEPVRVPDSVRHVPWAPPPVATVLRTGLGEHARNEDVEAVRDALPAEFAMRDLGRIVERLAAGQAPAEAVAEVLDEAGRRVVHEWFDGGPGREQLLAVTVIAFVSRLPERRFELCVRLLDGILSPARTEAASDGTAGSESGTASPAGDRPAITQDRRRNETLVQVLRVQDGASTRRVLAFAEDAYRPYVLEELTTGYGIGFWDSVRAWLNLLVLEKDDELHLGIGSALALLTYFDRDETETYLEEWSRGGAGWQGQATAVYALWFLCLDEAMVPIAQRIADDWAGQGTAEQRHTAIQAFAGELGVRLPQLGARRLWQLVLQENRHSEPAASAFGELFATLVARDGDAELLVEHLLAQLAKFLPIGSSQNRYRLTLVGVLSVVHARSARTGVPAVAEYLRDRPDRLAATAELWAAAIRHRPCRRSALEALLSACVAMIRRGGTENEREVQALADALIGALPPEELEPLKTDFGVLLTHTHSNAVRVRSFGEIMLAALDHAAAVLKRRPQ
ncbi:hypothetical protein [Actinomadura sp. 7K507]|uniref:hypothetical protein n=1 Tax=Actinomadura sp. 7K507 TaxID=2530365 RepID=UPI00104CFC8F|nr:hypothetical protein [Actinomadura sp. 7K507]TDC90228.1 hypothetical protein E1285_15160 [Actinomadura sp. 7K507]